MLNPGQDNRQVLSDYHKVLKTLDESLRSFAELKQANAALKAENKTFAEHADSLSAFSKEVMAHCRAFEKNLGQKNQALSSLYLGLVEGQFALVKENASLKRQVQILASLKENETALKSASAQKDELVHLQGLGTFKAMAESLAAQLAKAQAADQSLLEELFAGQSTAHKAFVGGLMELLQQQAFNYKSKLSAIMRLSSELIGELNDKLKEASSAEEYSIGLGKREQGGLFSLTSEMDAARLSAQVSRLSEENKFLLYALECLQNKIVQLNIKEFPRNLLSTEFLLKNKGFFAQQEGQLFASISELYQQNQKLHSELQRYKQSRFFSEGAVHKKVASLRELREEFGLISEQLSFDQEKETAVLFERFREEIFGQKSQIQSLQKKIIELQFQGKGRTVDSELLAKRLSQAENERALLIEHLTSVGKSHEQFKSRIEARLRESALPSAEDGGQASQVIRQLVESTSALCALLNESAEESAAFDSFPQKMADKLLERLSQENKALSFSLEQARNEAVRLEAEKQGLLAVGQNLEAELKRRNPNEMLEKLGLELEEKSLQVQQLKIQLEKNAAEYQARIAEANQLIQSLEGKISEIEQQAKRENQTALESFQSKATAINAAQEKRQQAEESLRRKISEEKNKLIEKIGSDQTAFEFYKKQKETEIEEFQKMSKEAQKQNQMAFESSIKEINDKHKKEIDERLKQLAEIQHEMQIERVTRDNFFELLKFEVLTGGNLRDGLIHKKSQGESLLAKVKERQS